jgi:hypothetical protein
MIARDFQPLDLYRIRVAATGLPAGWRGDGEKMLAAGPCWSVVRDGAVLVCLGLALPWRGRGCAWCIIGEDFPRSAWPWLHRRVRRGLPQVMARLGLHRIEAETLTGWEPGAAWLKKLGFTSEGPMEAYGPDGSDFDRWRLLRVAPRAASPEGGTHGD